MSNISKHLVTKIQNNSIAHAWDEAVKEWEVADCRVDERESVRCVCREESPAYLFTIQNKRNHKKIYPISESCIRKMGRKELNDATEINIQLFKLLRAIREEKYIELNSEYFTRKLLAYLYEISVFRPTRYNNFNGKNDYLFMLNMFNKRAKPSENQARKIRAIIANDLKPFLEEKLKEKVRTVS